MWTYDVKNKTLYQDGTVIYKNGYSGAIGYKDDPSKQCVKDKGPIPNGYYTITSPYKHPKLGIYTMNLTPDGGNNMCHRDKFRIHGDSQSHPGGASTGCIILKLKIRQKIWESNDHKLQVK